MRPPLQAHLRNESAIEPSAKRGATQCQASGYPDAEFNGGGATRAQSAR